MKLMALPADDKERMELLQTLYIRMCRDSHFGLKAASAATIVGSMLGISPLEVWIAMPSLDDMDRVASGQHACLKENGGTC